MTYSLDMREWAVNYVREGGKKVDACRLFRVDPKALYNWLHRTDLRPTPNASRRCKLDKEALMLIVFALANLFTRFQSH
jgi:putative transposase